MVYNNVNDINNTSKNVINLVRITIRVSIIVWTIFWAIRVTIIRVITDIFVVFISITRFKSLYFTLILLCWVRLLFPFNSDRFPTTINRFPTIKGRIRGHKGWIQTVGHDGRYGCTLKNFHLHQGFIRWQVFTWWVSHLSIHFLYFWCHHDVSWFT